MSPPSRRRHLPDLRRELAAGAGEGRIVCGVDEVGRGPLAGPVVAAAVVLPPEGIGDLPAPIRDSKTLAAPVRERLAAAIRAEARVGVGLADVAEIERLNILRASLLAMARAVAGLGVRPDHALVDGNQTPPLACRVETVVGGDAFCLSIAAASIVAKVERDRIMRELAAAHPGFGWERNAGYPTPEHREALRRLGPTPHHRRGFAPVADLFAVLG